MTDYCNDCGQVRWMCICEPYCGDCLIPINQCQHARDYVLSNNDKKVLRLIGSSLMTKQVNK